MRQVIVVIALGVVAVLKSRGGEDVPQLFVDESITPWGTVVERTSYYLKDGRKVQHGPDEMFSDDSRLEIRSQYAHGELHGVHESFYSGTSAKESESSYVAGVEHGPFRTWSPDGELLFEGTWRDGKKWNGWFFQGGTSGSGCYHQHYQNSKIAQWKDGKKVPGSEKEVECSWRAWKPGTLPDPNLFCRWDWYRFAKRDDYPYLEKAPQHSDIPFLIDYFARKKEHSCVAWDQLAALTRVQFGDPWLQDDVDLAPGTKEWKEWWRDVGRHRPAERKKRGVRDLEAWALVRGERDLPVPKRSIVIPETYKLSVHFRSGDYDAVTSETLTIERDAADATLVRSFSTRAKGPVTGQRWLPFGIEEADRVVRALGYLIDRPWLLNDDEEIEKRYWEDEKKSPRGEVIGGFVREKVRGRESYGSLYYPSARFELRDAEGMLWWNADVDSWHGGNPPRFNRTHEAAPGVVFPFLARLYPESELSEAGGTAGWSSK
jgi:hypothetical protein